MSVSVRTHFSHPYRNTDSQAVLNSRILNLIAGLEAFKIERSCWKLPKQELFWCWHLLIPRKTPRYLKSSTTTIFWLSLTSFVAWVPYCPCRAVFEGVEQLLCSVFEQGNVICECQIIYFSFRRRHRCRWIAFNIHSACWVETLIASTISFGREHHLTVDRVKGFHRVNKFNTEFSGSLRLT